MQPTLFPFSEILAQSTLTLTTASREAVPHVAPVYFVALQTPVVVTRGDDTAPFGGSLKQVISRKALYGFKPTWMRMVDDLRFFGFKQEWSYPDDDV